MAARRTTALEDGVIDERPLDRRAEDRAAPLPLRAVPDLQALLIEQADVLQTLGSDSVQLLHALDTVHDLIELRRRVRIWAEEIHAHVVPAMSNHETISQTVRASGRLSVVYSTDLGVR